MDEWKCPGCRKWASGEDCGYCGTTAEEAGYADELIDQGIKGESPIMTVRPREGARMNLRTAAIDFVAAQNTTDREELLFRAHRHASNLTGTLPVPVAQRTVQDFVAAVNREIPTAAKSEPKATMQRTAAVADFPDELMF